MIDAVTSSSSRGVWAGFHLDKLKSQGIFHNALLYHHPNFFLLFIPLFEPVKNGGCLNP
jgi:hypothetical protein